MASNSTKDYRTVRSAAVDALIIVDMQNGFIKPHDQIVQKIAALATSFPAERTFWLKYRNYPGSPFQRRLHWSDVMVSPETDIVPDLRPLVLKQNIVEHIYYDPPEEILPLLAGCQYVALAGTDTDACIQAASFFLWRHEMFPVILQDHCMSSGGVHLHRNTLDAMRRQFGVDAIVSDITASLMALGRTPPQTNLSLSL